MHPVRLDDGELALVKEALQTHNWKMLPTWKLKYVYQRFCKVTKDMKDIGAEAKEKINKDGVDLYDEAQKVFGIK